jgi:peptidoglycan/LPS O-acetylase OafA/YrhL
MMAGLFFAFLDRKFVELACIVWLTAAWFAAGHGPIVDALTATKFAYLFVLGIMFRRIATGEATGVTYAAIGLALFISGTIGNAVSVPISGFENFLITAGFSALFWVGVKGWFPAWAMPFLVYLGGISYSLYLLHQEIGFVVIHRLTQAGLPMFASIVVAILVAMLLAAGTRILVEKPSLQWARRYRAGLLAAPPAGAAETAVRLG